MLVLHLPSSLGVQFRTGDLKSARCILGSPRQSECELSPSQQYLRLAAGDLWARFSSLIQSCPFLLCSEHTREDMVLEPWQPPCDHVESQHTTHGWMGKQKNATKILNDITGWAIPPALGRAHRWTCSPSSSFNSCESYGNNPEVSQAMKFPKSHHS